MLKKCKEFKCDKCETIFAEEWKFKAHQKVHMEKYSCEVCEKTFKCEDILSKHQQIVHENLKLYCHYFNNLKTCPFKEECVFLHKVSKKCKFGIECERNMCMFRHTVVEEVTEKNVETAGQSDILDVDEEDETNDEQEMSNRSFDNPSQTEKSDKTDELFRCDICDFASAMKNIIENHKELLHNVCTKCNSSFASQKKLKSHIKNSHSEK